MRLELVLQLMASGKGQGAKGAAEAAVGLIAYNIFLIQVRVEVAIWLTWDLCP